MTEVERPEEVAVAPKGRGVEKLEEDGEIAADYLEELLDIADIDGDIDIDVDHGRAVVAIVSEDPSDSDLERLVGRDGQVLDALQELTRIAVQARTGERSRLMLDVSSYRDQRRQKLREVAREAIEQGKADNASVALVPMNAFERKVVHDAVSAAGLVSESSGVDPARYVVIKPA